MEFLLLAVLGLAGLGVKEALTPAEENKDGEKKKDDKKDDKKDGKEEPKKTPEQELMEAFAKYEASPAKDKKIKLYFQVEDK
jgi:hypothetical protein